MNTSSLGRARAARSANALVTFSLVDRPPNPRRIALDLVGQVGDVGVGESALVLGRVDHRRRPLVELLAVFGIALDAGDHEQVGVLGGSRTGEREQQDAR